MVFRTPRGPVPARQLFFRLGGPAVLFSGAVMLVLTLWAARDAHLAAQFDTDGRTALAVVERKTVLRSTNVDGSEYAAYALTLSYQSGTGTRRRLEKPVGPGEWDATGRGARVQLLYLATAPDRVELVPGGHRRTAQAVQAAALGAGLIWLALLQLVLTRSARAVQARARGQLRGARVLRVERGTDPLRLRTGQRLVWRDSTGQDGASLVGEGGALALFRPGDPIEVYVHEGRGWWIGDVGPRGG